MLTNYNEKWEERASELVSQRNYLVVEFGSDPNGKVVNELEERASNMLSRAKGKK